MKSFDKPEVKRVNKKDHQTDDALKNEDGGNKGDDEEDDGDDDQSKPDNGSGTPQMQLF